MATTTDDGLLVAEEVATLLRVSPKWVYAAAKRGRLPSVKAGRYVRFRRADIDEWIEQGGNVGD